MAKPGLNVVFDGPRERTSSLRLYAEQKRRVHRDIRHLQEILVIDVVRRLKARYAYNTKHAEPKPLFIDWLLDCGTLERTYAIPGYDNKAFRAAVTTRQASDLTLGANVALQDWFTGALRAQLGLPVEINVFAIEDGKMKGEMTLLFSAMPDDSEVVELDGASEEEIVN